MRHCYVLRVFTCEDNGGNHLGVIADSAGLDTASMQAIAADLAFSETVFIQWGADGPPAVRIFTPAAEMPFAGHPLVGAAWILGGIGPGTTDRMTCGIGEIPFEVVGDRARVTAPMTVDVEMTAVGSSVAAAACLPDPVRSWWARMPIPYLVIEVADPSEVASATPDFAALLAGPSPEATYMFSRDGDQVTARFFAPALGVDEDPATGSAAAALAAVMAHEGEAVGALTVFQGAETGFPSAIDLTWADDVVHLGGTVRRDEVRWLEA